MTALTLDLLKNWIRIRHAEEDVILDAMLAAAVEHIEGQTGQLFARREVRQPLYGLDFLNFGPVEGDVAIEWSDAAGVQSEVATIVRGRVSRRYPCNAVAVYQAGYADPEQVPKDLLVAALLLAGNWDANREASAEGATPLPFGVAALIDRYRRVLV